MKRWWYRNRWYLADLAVGVACGLVLVGVAAAVWMLVR